MECQQTSMSTSPTSLPSERTLVLDFARDLYADAEITFDQFLQKRLKEDPLNVVNLLRSAAECYRIEQFKSMQDGCQRAQDLYYQVLQQHEAKSQAGGWDSCSDELNANRFVSEKYLTWAGKKKQLSKFLLAECAELIYIGAEERGCEFK